MSDHEKVRRAAVAQGFAVLAFFFFSHGAHAATVPAHVQACPVKPVHAATLLQRRP
jgi:predicted lipoprotein